MPKRSTAGVPGPDEWAAGRIRHERELHGWSTGELARRVTEAGVPLRQQQVWQIENGEPPRRLSVGEAAAFAAVFKLTIADLVAPPEETANRNLIELGRKFAEWRRNAGILAAHLREISERATQLDSGEEEHYAAAAGAKWFGYADLAEQQAREFDEIAATYSQVARMVRDRASVWSVIASMRELAAREGAPEHSEPILCANSKNAPSTPKPGEQD